MGENGLLAAHRVGRNQDKTHDGIIVTDKVNEMWGTDMSQTVTLEEGRAYVASVDRAKFAMRSCMSGSQKAMLSALPSTPLQCCAISFRPARNW